MDTALPPAITELIAKLSSVKDCNNGILMEIMNEIAFFQEDYLSFAHFDHPETESYGRTLLYKHNRFKIILMSWAPGDFTAIHNHGNVEWGAVHSIGKATHRLYTIHNNTLFLQSSIGIPQGKTHVLSGNLIHMMGNLEKKNNISIHVYGLNSTHNDISKETKVFSPENNCIFETDGPAFLKLHPNLIHKREALTRIDPLAMDDYRQVMNKRNEIKQNIRNVNQDLYADQESLETQ
jgi:cysteine dioxygenase